MTKYSHTKLSTYQACPQKYKFRYLDGVERPFETIEAFVGNLVHETLAKLYGDLKKSKRNSEEELLSFYEQQWSAGYGPHIRVVRRDTTAVSYFAAGKEMISNYYQNHKSRLRAGETLGVEIEVSIALQGETEFHGVVDRLVKSGDDSYEIHDYKTSGRLPNQRDLEKDRQLTMYEVALRYERPRAQTVTLVWHYLRFGKEIRIQKTSGDLDAAKQNVLQTIQEIESAQTFPTRETALCDWCEYQQICPAKAKIIATPSRRQADETRDSGKPQRVSKERRSNTPADFGALLRSLLNWLQEPW